MGADFPIKFRTGEVFTSEDNLGIGEPVLGNNDPQIARFGIGVGGVAPRWFPGADANGNMFMEYGALVKSKGYERNNDHGFGFVGDDFIVKMKGIVVLRINTIGAQLAGALVQKDTDPAYLPGNSGLAELLFPLFNNKTIIVQFNRPAFAGVDSSNNLRTYRSILAFFNDFNISFTKVLTSSSGVATYVDNSGKYVNTSLNTPRITYNPISKKCLGLLFEPTSINIMPYSTDLTQWTPLNVSPMLDINTAWTNKGLSNPYLLTESSGTSEKSISRSFSSVVNNALGFSLVLQAKSFIGKRAITVFVAGTNRTQGFGINIDILNQIPTLNSNRTMGNGIVSSSKIEDIGNGLYRIKVIGTINPNSSVTTDEVVTYTVASLGKNDANTIYGNTNNLAYTTDNTVPPWFVINHAQVEKGTIVTSLMPTSGVPLSRGADILTINLSKFIYSTTEGIFKYVFKIHEYTPINSIVFSLQSADQTNRIDYYISSIDTNANTLTIGTKSYTNGSLTTTVTNFVVTSLKKSELIIEYTNIDSSLNYAVISGVSGFFATVKELSYE